MSAPLEGRGTVRVVVVIPALDEEEALPLVLAEIPEGVVESVVVCDNGSRDRTAEVAVQALARVVREDRRGYGSACLAALSVVLGTHPDPEARLDPPLGPRDVIVFLDADHSDYPEEIPEVIRPILEDRADLVIGSRVLGGASMDAMLPQAWIGNRLACFLMYVLFGARHTDLGPFRAIRRDALDHLSMGDRDFGWTVEMQLKARVARMRVAEVPVRYRPRIGESKITGTVVGSLLAAWKILGWIIGWRLKLWLLGREIPRFR